MDMGDTMSLLLSSFLLHIMSEKAAMKAILHHLQLLAADVKDLRMEMHVRFDDLSKRIDRNSEQIKCNSKQIDRNSRQIKRNTERIDAHHRLTIEGAKDREERIVRLENAVFA